MKRRGEMRRTKRFGVRGGAVCGAAGVCLVFLLSALALSGCRVVTGSGKQVTTKVDAAGFTKVKANDSWDVTLVRGDSYSVRVTCDDDLADMLDVTSDGDTLVLRLKPRTSWFTITSRVTFKATVVMPRLDGLDLADSSKAAVTGFSSGGSFAVRLHDASSVVFHDLGAGVLDARAANLVARGIHPGGPGFAAAFGCERCGAAWFSARTHPPCQGRVHRGSARSTDSGHHRDACGRQPSYGRGQRHAGCPRERRL